MPAGNPGAMADKALEALSSARIEGLEMDLLRARLERDTALDQLGEAAVRLAEMEVHAS